jgi:hypothetical protein
MGTTINTGIYACEQEQIRAMPITALLPRHFDKHAWPANGHEQTEGVM